MKKLKDLAAPFGMILCGFVTRWVITGWITDQNAQQALSFFCLVPIAIGIIFLGFIIADWKVD